MTRIIDTTKHTGWGNNVSWFSPPARETRKRVLRRSEKIITGTFVGWLDRPPVEGDIIQSPDVDGKPVHWRVTSVQRQQDPPDMFFADVEYIGRVHDDTQDDSLHRRQT